jgi:transposase InsO family protein
MDLHSLAALVPARRIELVQCVEQGLPVAQAARLYMVSRPTVYKWLRRWRAGDLELHDRSSRPQHCAWRLSDWQRELIVLLRLGRLLIRVIAADLQLARSTVGRWVKAAGLGRLRRLDYEPPVQRYEMSRPGELVHIDIKPLRTFAHPGRLFSDAGGKRQRGASAKQYLHVAVDAYSRYAVAAILPRQGGADCAAFMQLAQQRFAAAGITVERVLTDNGVGYRSKRVKAAMLQLGLRHSFTRVRRPQTNGKAERFIRTAGQEWAFLHYFSSTQRNAALPRWLEYYNHHRPHHALNCKPPCSRLPVSTTS